MKWFDKIRRNTNSRRTLSNYGALTRTKLIRFFSHCSDPKMPRKSEYYTLNSSEWIKFDVDWRPFDSNEQWYLQLGKVSVRTVESRTEHAKEEKIIHAIGYQFDKSFFNCVFSRDSAPPLELLQTRANEILERNYSEHHFEQQYLRF